MLDDSILTDREASLMRAIRDGGLQIQLEEGFSHAEQQAVMRFFGINWYHARRYEEAKEALDSCRNREPRMPIYVISLSRSLSILLTELLPVVMMLRVGGDMGEHAPMPEAQDLMDRLRHHYLIEHACQRQNMEEDVFESGDVSTILLPESRKEQAEGIKKVWKKNLKQGLLVVLEELGIEKTVADNIIALRNGAVELHPRLTPEKKELANTLIKAIPKVHEELDAQFDQNASQLPLKSLTKVIPPPTQIALIIRGYLAKELDLGQFIKVREQPENRASDTAAYLSDALGVDLSIN